ncbi:MAG: adenine deaminase, partial [Bacteroidia bacterium]|nr:adenine deaminase [Bacteroidia bacterium]
MIVEGNIVDIRNRRIYGGKIEIVYGKILTIWETDKTYDQYILPGFIDAHIHIESSMLVPSEFARIAVKHGTVATVSDPHEIANVLGVPGVEFMIENGKTSPLKFYFGAPSCVPATTFETAGATIDSEGIKKLLSREEIKYLAEMMNYPGVIYKDPEVLKKIEWAKHYKKPVDGHAPGLSGDDLTTYIDAGITTDHEAFTYEEGLEKLSKGMKVLIREGSAAKNFEVLAQLIPDHYKNMMFCSDDKHPDDLLLGHINKLCARSIAKGFDLFDVLKMACINPIEHYDLDVGSLQIDDKADFIVVKDLVDFEVVSTYINGNSVYHDGKLNFERTTFENLNRFATNKKITADFELKADHSRIRVIEARDGELITGIHEGEAIQVNGNLVSNVSDDILKMTVVNRYKNQKPAIGFIRNIGLKKGAIASSVGHDSHNIIAVGVNDELLCKAVNTIIDCQGGICVVTEDDEHVLPLPVAGIMSDKSAEWVGEQYAQLDKLAKALGSDLQAPFMTLSFMALLVI